MNKKLLILALGALAICSTTFPKYKWYSWRFTNNTQYDVSLDLKYGNPATCGTGFTVKVPAGAKLQEHDEWKPGGELCSLLVSACSQDFCTHQDPMYGGPGCGDPSSRCHPLAKGNGSTITIDYNHGLFGVK